MENLFAYLALITTLIVMFGWWYTRRQENFKPDFLSASASTEFLDYLDMGDHRTMVQSQRGNNGDTVILIHGSPMNIDMWKGLFQLMQRNNMSNIKTPNLVAYDLRGHGTAWVPVEKKYNDSAFENYAWSIDTFANDLKKVYDNIVKEKVILCAFGFGGLVAQKFALKYPELVKKLVLLQSTISPSPGLRERIEYLSGPSGWIARNPSVTYLTNEERFVQETLCNWFYLPLSMTCPPDTLIDESDPRDDELEPQYNVVERMLRQASSTTDLQTSKMAVSIDLAPEWINSKAKFPIHILAATDDPTAPSDMMTRTFTTIYNNNRSLIVALDIVNGRHGFTIMRPDYIAGIICTDCKKISNTTT